MNKNQNDASVGNTIISDRYDEKGRFASYWHQIHEVKRLTPKSYLEVGIGTGLVSSYLRNQGLSVTTLDIDSKLKPDINCSVLEIPTPNNSFEVTACCQVLEHIPYDKFVPALVEIKRVTAKKLILSLPDLERRYKILVNLPKIGTIEKLIEVPRVRRLRWSFNGEHYWNIGTGEHPLKRITVDIQSSGWTIERTYCVFEMPWHRFFILNKD